MPTGLPPAANFATAPRGVDFEHLAAGVGIDFGVQHQHVDVAAAGQHVIQPAVADVVGPAVAAEDPDALAHQLIGQRQQQLGLGRVEPLQLLLQRRDAFALVVNAGFVALVGVEDAVHEILAERAAPASCSSSAANSFCLSIETRKPRPNSALSSNSELHQVGPRPSAFVGVGRGRQVAAVNRGAAGGVGDHHAVAEQLREHLDVRRFAAAGARAGELEQRPHAPAAGAACRA